MDTNTLLKQFGMTDKDVKVYLAILEFGLCGISQIARKTKIQRTLLYDVTKRMISQGVLKIVTKNKKSLYSAISPHEMLELQQQKVNRLKQAIPQLSAICNLGGKKPAVFYYEGKVGIDYMNSDTLKNKGEIVAFTSPRYVSYQQKYISKEYSERRKLSGNKARIIGEQSSEIVDLKRKDNDSMRITKILPRELFSSDIELGISGNKVYIIDYKDEFGFIIEGESIAHTLKMIFNVIWNNAEDLK